MGSQRQQLSEGPGLCLRDRTRLGRDRPGDLSSNRTLPAARFACDRFVGWTPPDTRSQRSKLLLVVSRMSLRSRDPIKPFLCEKCQLGLHLFVGLSLPRRRYTACPHSLETPYYPIQYLGHGFRRRQRSPAAHFFVEASLRRTASRCVTTRRRQHNPGPVLEDALLFHLTTLQLVRRLGSAVALKGECVRRGSPWIPVKPRLVAKASGGDTEPLLRSDVDVRWLAQEESPSICRFTVRYEEPVEVHGCNCQLLGRHRGLHHQRLQDFLPPVDFPGLMQGTLQG